MEQNKLNVEVKKINKTSNEIEWTKTLEIPYDNENLISKEEKKQIEQKYGRKEESNSINKDKNFLLNTSVLEMESNPFHQSLMNTMEFDNEEFLIQATIFKKNEQNEITHKDEINALEKLLENNIITKNEFEQKKSLILNKKNL